VPESWSEPRERQVVAEVAALLPPLVQLEFDGRYQAMLSHEPKNYALLGYDGRLVLKGVAFRSSRAEPFGEAFLRRALECLLKGDVPGVRQAFVETVTALRARLLPTYDVSSRVRLTKSAARYLEVRDTRRELTYEALLASGRTNWVVGERIRVYKTLSGYGNVVADAEDGSRLTGAVDPRDYDVEHYVRVLRENFAERLSRGLRPEHFAAIIADPEQPSLFDAQLESAATLLTPLASVFPSAQAADKPELVSKAGPAIP
jgi:DNA polymerase elongation subunit (family B)